MNTSKNVIKSLLVFAAMIFTAPQSFAGVYTYEIDSEISLSLSRNSDGVYQVDSGSMKRNLRTTYNSARSSSSKTLELSRADFDLLIDLQAGSFKYYDKNNGHQIGDLRNVGRGFTIRGQDLVGNAKSTIIVKVESLVSRTTFSDMKCSRFKSNIYCNINTKSIGIGQTR